MLVVAIFVCFCLVSSAEQTLNTADPLSKIKDFHSDFVNHRQSSDAGKLQLSGDTVYFPWAPQQASVFDHSTPVKETLNMNGSCSSKQVGDLKAMNSVKQRDITYDEYQKKDCDSSNLVNTMDVLVQGEQGGNERYGFDDSSLETFVDNAMTSSMNRDYSKNSDGNSEHQHAGNYMNIDVSGITVSAVNTVKGGSAVATSNIIIKPVQVIVCPSEVEEKLK